MSHFIYRYAECRVLPNLIMLSVIMLNIIMLSVVILNVITPIVVAPNECFEKGAKYFFKEKFSFNGKGIGGASTQTKVGGEAEC
jgi:hypothetical protein